jgi:hypothetical protein
MDDEWDDMDLDEDEIELLGELLGEDEDDDEDPILGQRFRMHRRITARRGGGRGLTRARKRIRRALVSRTPGVPKPGARELYLPFTGVQFDNTSALTLTATARPQIPIKGRRLVVGVTRSVAGSGGALTVVSFRVGQREQPASAGGAPVETFAAGSFGVDLAVDPAQPGIEVTIQYNAAAQPGVGETVDITTVLIGLAIS